MSIEQLRDMRRNGHKPLTTTVIVGRPCKSFEDNATTVIVRDGMDLSPLVGLRVQVIDLQRDPAVTRGVVDQLERLQVVLVGACGPYGSIAYSPEYETAMQRYREALCPTA